MANIKQKTCSCCGRELIFIGADKRNWVYKVLVYDEHRLYQCSYPCWRKESRRIESERKSRGINKERCVEGIEL